jgi:hypothetical protein
MIEEGWRAYLRVSFEFAQSRLAAARTDAEELVALPGGVELYADASLRLGIVLGQLGRAAESQAALALALALDPDRPITLAEFSPEVVAAVDTARAQSRVLREVAISTEPAGAQVSVDGKELGASPARASIAVGQHVVVARGPGLRARVRAFAVDEGTADLTVPLELDDVAAAVAAGPRVGLADSGAQELIDAVARFAELDEVVLVATTDRRGGEALLVQRCAGLPSRCTAVVELGYDGRAGLAAASRAAWADVHSAELRYPPSVLADPRLAGERIVRHPCSICRNPWLWTGVGVGAVIGTIAIVAAVSAAHSAPILLVRPPDFVK